MQPSSPTNAVIGPLWVDTVEKVPGMSPARNKRIMGVEFLNRSCAFDARLESMLLGDPPKNPFSTASVKIGHSDYVCYMTGCQLKADLHARLRIPVPQADMGLVLRSAGFPSGRRNRGQPSSAHACSHRFGSASPLVGGLFGFVSQNGPFPDPTPARL